MSTYTCPRCGRTSYNPHDLAHRYCGACHLSEDDLIRELIAAEHLWRVVTPRFVAGLITDAQGRIRTAAPILRKWQGLSLPELELVADTLGWQLTRLS
jgi:ribosomal protein L37E